jgi:hypothetical protein
MSVEKPPILAPNPAKSPVTRKQLIIAGAAMGAVYGLVARFAFGYFHQLGANFEVMSETFILGVPLALGFISALVSHQSSNQTVWNWLTGLIFVPFLSSLAFLALALLLAWEGAICVVLWLPVVLPLSSIGAFLGIICLKIVKSKRNRSYCIAAAALLPFLISPIEQLKTPDAEIRTVPTEIKIHASAQTVWNQIKSVPLISEQEQSFSFSHLIGFPRPLEARLVGEGVGAVRYATFEKGVLFVETINQWDEPHRLSFSIRADTKNIPPKTFDEHVIIGGRYFDVLNGTYWIEDIGNGDVILHLSSEQRLSTRFNFYSHYWTEYLMADLQNYILGIIKKRCEQQA